MEEIRANPSRESETERNRRFKAFLQSFLAQYRDTIRIIRLVTLH